MFCARRGPIIVTLSACTARWKSSMNLAAKIADSSAVVAVMGLGYVGLPLLAAFSRAGFPVLGFDVDDRKIQALRRGENYLKHLGPTLVSDVVKAGKAEFTSDPARLSGGD